MFLETTSLTVPLVSGVAFEEVFEDVEETWSAWFRFLHDDSNIRSRNLRKTLPLLLIVLFNVPSIVTRTWSRGYVSVVSRIDEFTFEQRYM